MAGFGETMRAARKAQGLTMRDVRLMTGIVESELKAFEEGARSPGSSERAMIADALDLDIGRKGRAEGR